MEWKYGEGFYSGLENENLTVAETLGPGITPEIPESLPRWVISSGRLSKEQYRHVILFQLVRYPANSYFIIPVTPSLYRKT